MAFTFDVNTIPATGAVCIFKLRTALLVQLWTSQKDSDGTTYSSGGTQLTSGGSGANGLGNTNAWFVVRDPNSTRSFCWQRGTTNLLWRVKYSASAGFVGGSPAATQVPSATDEQIVTGGGTDAAPTFTSIFTTDGSMRFNVVAGDATVGYGFLYNAFTSGSPSLTVYGFCLDVMATGSYPASDTDPAIVYATPVSGSTSAWGTDMTTNVTSTHAWLSTTWQGITGVTYQDPSSTAVVAPASVAGQGTGTNPFSGEDAGLPLPFARAAAHVGGPSGFKGFGSLLRWSSTVRANGDTISNTGASSRDKMWMNGCRLPWDGSIPIL
jgi:hypothetical protein